MARSATLALACTAGALAFAPHALASPPQGGPPGQAPAAAAPGSQGAQDPGLLTPDPSGQTAAADATAGQSGTGNGNVSARVDTPGSNGAVSQGNGADASASAGAQGNANGQGNGNANGQGNGNANGNGNGGASSSAGAVQADPQNANVDVRVDSPGHVGAVTQSNDAQASAGASGATTAPPADSVAPADPAAPAGTSAQDPASGDAAAATGTADSSQASAGNGNVQVRVGSPGDDQAVQQANTSQADASATAGGAGAPATADASATQTDPTNLNVTIRVGSPGDNGDVRQTNESAASAGSGTPAPAAAPSADTGNGADTVQSVETSGSSDATNLSAADQQVEQVQGVEPPASPEPAPADAAPAAADGTATGSASATQTGATNLNVSVRVGSPGNDGTLTQLNTVAASGTSPELGVVTTDGGANTSVSVVIPGSVTAPGATWSWTWIWDGAWTPPADAAAEDVAPTSDTAWNWAWQSQDTATPTTPPAPDASSGPATGVWDWSWSWTLPGGRVWSGGWERPCDCNWTWSWTWDWSAGAPGSSAPAAAPAPASSSDAGSSPAGALDSGPVTQENSATAAASASIDLSTARALDQSQTGGASTASATQAGAGGQLAVASASAVQSDALNLASVEGAPTDGLSQANDVLAQATAEVDATLVQMIRQQQRGRPETSQSANAQQLLASTQVAVASARAAQSAPGNLAMITAAGPNEARVGRIEQANTATATAKAAASADLRQSILQLQDAGAALLQEEDASQVLVDEQVAVATAVVGQETTWNVADLLVPRGSRATNPSLEQRNDVLVDSSALDWSVARQSIVQSQDGSADVEVSVASQELTVRQVAVASSPAAQANLLNRSGWLGVEPVPARSQGAPAATVEGGQPALPGLEPVATAASSPSGDDALRPRPSPCACLQPGVEMPGPGVALPPSLPVAGGAAAASVPEAAVVQPQARAAAGPEPGSALADAGAGTGGPAGSAPHGGSGGPFGQLARTHKLVAPAHLGPQSPAPTLGRSVAFLEPIERPG